MICERGTNRPCTTFPRLGNDDYLSSAARATRREGACLIADCGLPATHEGVCVRHDAQYRLRCACGKILTDAGVERNACSDCYQASPSRRKRLQATWRRVARQKREKGEVDPRQD